MATQWHYRVLDQEFGPVPFAELVRLVREEMLGDGDLVRQLPFGEWQRADKVPGLFYMARRQPASEPIAEALSVEDRTEEPAPVEQELAADSTGDSVPEAPERERPDWLRKILFFRGIVQRGMRAGKQSGAASILEDGNSSSADEPSAPSSKGDEALPDDPDGGLLNPSIQSPSVLPSTAAMHPDVGGSTWSNTVGAALESIDSRQGRSDTRASVGRARRLWNPVRRLVGELLSPSMLRPVFRIGTGFLFANLTAFWIENWAAREAIRFPSRNHRDTAQFVFPLVGSCNEGVYYALLVNLIIVTGILGYLMARWLDSHAEN